MSLKFLQFQLPCKTCIVQAICKDNQSASEIKLNRSNNMCLAIPDWDMNKKVYIKGLFECWVNIGSDIITPLIREKNNNNSNLSCSVSTQYIDMLIDIIESLEWMVNSTSWKEGELYGFDAVELKLKLKNITNWLQNTI